MTERLLSELLAGTRVVGRHGAMVDGLVTAVTQDSREVVSGALFVAVPGFHVDGHDFLTAAVAVGARALVVQSDRRALWEEVVSDIVSTEKVAVVEVSDTRAALADLSAAWHGYPARDLRVVGVTGTDGKSTTCYMLSSILEAAGRRTGIIGGVEFKVGDEWRANTITQTSPEAPLVQSLLAEMVAAGVTDAVVESTSHGLVLHRLDHCEYDVAVFTGLSDDHLDFHETREEYFAAKLRLFEALDGAVDKGAPKRAVIHGDDPHIEAIKAALSPAVGAELVRVGFEKDGLDVSVSDLDLRAEGSVFRLATPSGALDVSLALPGRFNVHNALLAAGAAQALGVGIIPIVEGLSALRGVPGRMERIEAGQPFSVVVDAAATTDAFRMVLESVKPLVKGRLIVVFGCAGERDPGRRTGMGAVAAEFADLSVLTSENPRSEDAAAIVREIAAAMEVAGRVAGRDFEELPDRREAIARAFALAEPGDYVLIAGKGAEQTLITGTHVAPWDDRDVARALLRR